VLVGGPQYRVGSHRQFVLLARRLADAGVAVLRFDLAGMGDSSGPQVTFETANSNVAAAMDALLGSCGHVRSVALWGLCDGASAALMYAARDARVAGLVILNPWVRSSAGLARAHLRGHYLQRFVSPAYWLKVLRSPATLLASARSLGRDLATARMQPGHDAHAAADSAHGGGGGHEPYLERMLEGAKRFRGRVLVLLSGRDLTAGEFKALLRANRAWRRAFSRRTVLSYELAESDHTFSSRERREWVADRTLEFLRSLAVTA
jgi:exosortase A-associated hydrolase 1